MVTTSKKLDMTVQSIRDAQRAPPKNVQIYFLLVRIKIKHMEMAIIRRETAGTGSNQYNESETITKYEVMDGAPAKGK